MVSVNRGMARSQLRRCGNTAAVDVTQYSGTLWPRGSLSKSTAGPRFVALRLFLTVGLFFLLNGGIFLLSLTNASDVSAVPHLPHPTEYTLGKWAAVKRDTDKDEYLYMPEEASAELAKAQEEQVDKEELYGLATGAGEYAASAGKKQFPNETYLATNDDQQRARQEAAIAAEAAGSFDSRDVIASSVASVVSESLEVAQSSLHGNAGKTNEDEGAASGGAIKNATERLNQAGAPLLLNLVKEANVDTGVEETGAQWWDQDIKLMPNTSEGNQMETADFGAMLRELLSAPTVDASETAGEPEAQGDAVATAQRERPEESAPEDDNYKRALTAAGSAGTPPAKSEADAMVSADGGAAEETTTGSTEAEWSTAHSSQLLSENTEAELTSERLLSQTFLHSSESEQHVTVTDADTPTAEGATGTLVRTDGGAADDTTTASTGAEWESTHTTQLLSESSRFGPPFEDSLSEQLRYGDEYEQHPFETQSVPGGTADTFSGAQSRDIQPSVRAELSLEAIDTGLSPTEDGIDKVATEESRGKGTTSQSGRTMKILRGAAVSESTVVRSTNPVSQSGKKVSGDNSLTSGQSKDDVDCQPTGRLTSRHQDLTVAVEEQGDRNKTRKTVTLRGTKKGSTSRDHEAMKSGAHWKKIMVVGAAAGLAAAGAKGLSGYTKITTAAPAIRKEDQNKINVGVRKINQ